MLITKLLSESQLKDPQHWGHNAVNCHMTYSCVKCKENHNPDVCAYKHIEQDYDSDSQKNEPYYIQCQWYDYFIRASYRRFPRYTEL